jgi:predicted negative regulator of RcsB-dependent stress response
VYPSKWVTKWHLQIGNVYDSYGDYFVAKKDNANAIAQFEKALSVAENADTRKKLEELKKEVIK